ncbi:MAG: hypothetical protein VKK59_02185 [Vampirovibrionales bacterium]|nr:hypothetical protein [Vampirovibrionales bacterium]
MAFANAQDILQLSTSFFKRNNPLEAIVSNVMNGLQYVMTIQSQKKLMKFRFLLYQQQLNSIDNNVTAGSSRQALGQVFNRAY